MKRFEGVLTIVDKPSDSPLQGANGHRVVLTRHAIRHGIDTLVGKPLNCGADLEGHNRENVIGLIQSVFLDERNRLLVFGQIDEEALPRTSDTLGMSIELDNVMIDDTREDIWRIKRCAFSGGAVLKRRKAAYKATDFRIKRGYFA